jgi:radical SAM superfamily enzyme YgiQ (UPF0313 family)
MTEKFIPISVNSNQTDNPKKTLVELHEEFNDPYLPEDKHISTIKSMLKYARPRPQANLSAFKVQTITRKTHIALVLMPKWAVFFAPYNIARLTAVTRQAGYKTSAFDWNVETWNHLRKTMGKDNDPFEGHGSRDYLWLDDMYDRHLKDKVEPLLESYLEELVSLQPDVVGFSLYYTNVKPTLWMARKIKERLPNTIILAGGSHIHWNPDPFPEFDHVVKGEGEEVLLELLDKIENGEKLTQYQYNADTTKRLNLDTLPFPDYSDFDINKYMMPNAFSSEFSRGCVAKCTFCAETHYWKYRSRQSPMVLDEVEFQYKNFGINFFWFIDSLVNGNINELRAFAIGVVERGLKIRWTGYARCDERMDFDYYKDLRASGCTDLNYGIESGSNRVLNDMRKNITVSEVEQNLSDGNKNYVGAATNWMLGYVTERSNDFAHTLTLLWRVQKFLINVSRQTMLLGPSRVKDDPDRFGVHEKFFLWQWASKDHENTKLHRLIRLKAFNIFTQLAPRLKANEDRSGKLLQTYNINKISKEFNTDLYYEEFDYEIIKDPKLSCRFSQTLVNEIWPLFRTLWRSRNHQALDISVNFDPEWDMNNYGNRLADNLTACYKFSIDDDGNWTMDCSFRFVGPENIYQPWQPNEGEQIDFNIDLNWNGSGHWSPPTSNCTSQVSNP